MSTLISNVQERFKISTNYVALLALRLVSGFMLGLTLAFIGQELMDYGVISVAAVVLVTMACMLRITRFWTWTNMFIFDLICVLIGLCLRMYILIAPGS